MLSVFLLVERPTALYAPLFPLLLEIACYHCHSSLEKEFMTSCSSGELRTDRSTGDTCTIILCKKVSSQRIHLDEDPRRGQRCKQLIYGKHTLNTSNFPEQNVVVLHATAKSSGGPTAGNLVSDDQDGRCFRQDKNTKRKLI